MKTIAVEYSKTNPRTTSPKDMKPGQIARIVNFPAYPTHNGRHFLRHFSGWVVLEEASKTWDCDSSFADVEVEILAAKTELKLTIL